MSENVNVSNQPQAAPKKDHTVAIIIIVLVGVFILPIIIGGLLMFGIFGFAITALDEIDFDDLAETRFSVDGYALTHNEAVSARSLIAQLENKVTESATISQKDCKYLERIATYYDNSAWFAEKDNTTFCEGTEAYAGFAYDSAKMTSLGGLYTLNLSDGVSCAVFQFDVGIRYATNFKLSNKSCGDDTRSVTIIDTEEELEPLGAGHNGNKEDGDREPDDDSDNVYDGKA